MSDSPEYPPDDLKRIPGLFRQWELQEVLEAHRCYQIEDAGAHADGTPLLALYANDTAQCRMAAGTCGSVQEDEGLTNCPQVPPVGSVPEQFIGQGELARRWNISPRTLERWRRLGRGPTYLKLHFRVVYNLRHIRAFEADHLHLLQPEPAVHRGRGEQP